MTNNDKIKLNDIVCSKDTIDNDLTKCPTIDEKLKEDTQRHPKPTTQLHRLTPSELYQIDRRAFSKNYIMVFCQHCGHKHPLSRYEYKKIETKMRHKWSVDMNYKLNAIQRTQRATKAGIARAIKAGQKLRKPIPLQIQNSTAPLVDLKL